MASEKKDYYEILGVPRNASADEIKRAYRKLTKKYHPDANPGDKEAEAKFKEINEAHDVLSDPQKKAQFDQFGYVGDMPPGGGFGGFDGGFGGFGDLGDLGDLFGSFFGGGAGRSRSSDPNAPRRGADLEMTMRITLEMAYRGSKKTIEVPHEENCSVCGGSGAEPGSKAETCSECKGKGQVERVMRTPIGQMVQRSVCPKCGGKGKTITRPCKSCHGTGRVRKEQKIDVTIDAGIDTGMRLRIPGRGEAGRNGGADGDLYILFDVASDPRFERDGDDLHMRLDIAMPQAVLGASVPVKTFDGDETFDVPAGTQPGSTIRIKNRGMPRFRSSGKGDMVMHVKVSIPKDLSDKGRKLMAELAQEMKVSVAGDKGLFEKIKSKLS